MKIQKGAVLNSVGKDNQLHTTRNDMSMKYMIKSVVCNK